MVNIPEFVNLNGRKTRFSDLPKGTQDALIKGLVRNDTAISNVLQKGTGTNLEASLTADQIIGSNLAGKSKTQLIQKVLSNPNLSPREAIKIREKAINGGIEHTSLHLGQATPEVIAQLQASRAQNNFQDKQAPLDLTISQLQEKGVVLGNSSTRPELSRQTAGQTIKIQQEFTKAVTGEVRQVLDSQAFEQQKQGGQNLQAFNELLNANVTPASKSNSAIVTELAQADIQGENQTARNIEQILAKEGINTPVNVNLGREGQIATFTTNDFASALPQISQLQGILGGGLEGNGIESITTPKPESFGLESFGLGGLGGVLPEGFADGVPSLPIIGDIGKIINDLLGLDINPNITGLAVTLIPIFIILAVLL